MRYEDAREQVIEKLEVLYNELDLLDDRWLSELEESELENGKIYYGHTIFRVLENHAVIQDSSQKFLMVNTDTVQDLERSIDEYLVVDRNCDMGDSGILKSHRWYSTFGAEQVAKGGEAFLTLNGKAVVAEVEVDGRVTIDTDEDWVYCTSLPPEVGKGFFVGQAWDYEDLVAAKPKPGLAIRYGENQAIAILVSYSEEGEPVWVTSHYRPPSALDKFVEIAFVGTENDN